MDKKELMITGIVIVLAVVAAGVIFAPSTAAQYTSIDVLNKGDLGENSTIYVKLTCGDKTSLSGKTIHIKLTDNKNNVVYDESVETQATGVAIVKLNNLGAGEYKLDASFDGDENYTGCSISQNVTIKEGEVKDELANSTLIQQTIADSQGTSSQSSSAPASSSSQSSSSDSSSQSSSVPASSSSQSSSSDSSSSSSADSSSNYYDENGKEVLPEYDADGKQIN
ncbi:Ig-like domain-containing protein [Methanobrevibacter sp.]|uniref:Ig-like domain-containing protein n=1 Tax=Methanobrevibacter sp. TaxID=66852 RepID=UPI00388D22F0